jgi:uncharacterized DUF497 family protein
MRRQWTIRTPKPGAFRDEARFVTLGMDATGRVLVIVWTPRGDRARLIPARKASRREAAVHAQ